MGTRYLASIDGSRYSPFHRQPSMIFDRVEEPAMQHPVVIIGAGPIGLAAAANAAERDLDFVVLEAGGDAGAAISEWAHVRLFSAWRELVDPAARRLLEAAGTWTRAGGGRLPDRWRVARAVPSPVGRPGGRLSRRHSALRRQGDRREPCRTRPARRQRPRERPVRRTRRDAVGSRAPAGRRGRGCVRHLDPAEPARRRRLPRCGRAGERRAHQLRDPRPHRPDGGRPVRREARRGRRQGRLGPRSADRPDQTRPPRQRSGSAHAGVVAAATSQPR